MEKTKPNPIPIHYNLAVKKINLLDKNQNFKLLEVGAGHEILKQYLPKNIHYSSLDMGGDVWDVKPTLIFDLDSGKIPLKNNTFDIIVCNETLEHTMYPERIIEEIKRIAKKDAIFFFSMPNDYNFVSRSYYFVGHKSPIEESFKVVEKHLHIHRPRVQDIIDLFSKNFKIQEIDYTWESTHSNWSKTAKNIDKIINILAKVIPNLFARQVVIEAKRID